VSAPDEGASLENLGFSFEYSALALLSIFEEILHILPQAIPVVLARQNMRN